MTNTGTFSDYQTHPTFGAAAIVVDDIVTGNIVIGRKVSGHGRHNNAVF
jgi:hypothetical protein